MVDQDQIVLLRRPVHRAVIDKSFQGIRMHQGTFFRPRQPVFFQQDQGAPLPVVRAFHLPHLVAVGPYGIGPFQRQVRNPSITDSAGQDDDIHRIRNLRVHHFDQPIRNRAGLRGIHSGAVGPEQDCPRRGLFPGFRRAGAAEEGNGQQDCCHGEKNECSFFHVSLPFPDNDPDMSNHYIFFQI